MKCPICQHDNQPGARFCNACGTPLEAQCSTCGHRNAPASRYCSECGQALRADPSRGGEAAMREPEGERRQLSVMFCDLVGSTPLSQQLDPEDLRRAVRAFQETSAALIARYEGFLAQYLGDGLLVYFGYPVAHEDDAERAVRAALSMLAAMPALNERLRADIPLFRTAPLQVRIGIHTGLAVTGEVGGHGRHDALAIGDTPNIAARLEGLAAPDSVVISGDTHRLVGDLFDARDLGPLELRGVAAPVRAYEIRGERAGGSRASDDWGVSRGPIIGRDQELGLLLERWDQAREGLGQAVLLTGEAGIGKSRLLRALRDRIEVPAEWRLHGRCSPYHQHSPLHPMIDLMRRAFQLQREDSAERMIEKMEQALGQYGLDRDGLMPFIAGLIGIDLPERYAAPRLSPEEHRRRTLEAIVGVLLAMAGRDPLLLTLEDLHWIDPSTLELVDLLIDQVPTVRILFIVTARPPFNPPWTPRSHLTTLTLSRFSRRHIEQIVAGVTGGKALPAEVLDQLVDKTDGVPLFVEELTKFVLESRLLVDRGDRFELTGPLPPLAIPSTLQDSLMARLDRLAPVKQVAQLGATLGRAFSHELLLAVGTLDDRTLQAALAQLVAAEMLYQRGLGAHATYVFKHALIQETAYQSLLRSTRQQYHHRIAQVLADQFPDTRETQPEILAHHHAEAGEVEPAVEYLKRAGGRALARSAHREALTHLTRGLDLIATLPAAPRRAAWELDLRTMVGPAIVAIRGQSSAEAQRNYARALELCEEIGDAPQLFPVLVGLRRFYSVRGELSVARRVAEQIMSLARPSGKPPLLIEAHHSLANVLFWLGEMEAARAHVDSAVALGRQATQEPRMRAPHYVTDPLVTSLSYGAWIYWALGHPDQALASSEQAVRLAEDLDHPHSTAVALDFATGVRIFRREGEHARAMAERTIAVSEEHGFAFWSALGTIRRGWALAALGRLDEGIDEIRRGLERHRSTGAELARPFLLGLLADACAMAGRGEEGAAAAADAIETGERSGERFYLAELCRLAGELRLRQGPAALAEAEALFQRALDTARGQGARAFELRAATSLARLWLRQGRRDAARDLLGGVCGAFTEGLDSPDMLDARAVLRDPADGVTSRTP